MMNSEKQKSSSDSIAPFEGTLADIFNLEEIQRMQDLFSDATGVASIITTPDGKPITKPSNFCHFCHIVRSTDKGLRNCIKSDEMIGGIGIIAADSIRKTCLSAGLYDSGASIVVDGNHLANWLIGQVRNEQLTDQHILDYADKIGADKEELIKAFYEIPVMTADEFEKVTKMLSVFANEFSQKAYYNYQLKLEVQEKGKAYGQLQKTEEFLSMTLQSLLESERSKSVMLSNLPGMAYRCKFDRNWTMEFVSEGCYELTGYRSGEFIGISPVSFNDLILPEYRETLWQKWEEALGFDRAVTVEYEIQTATNEIKWVWEQGVPIFNQSGEIVALEGLILDITARKKMEDTLVESEKNLRKYQDIAQLGTYTLDYKTLHLIGSEVMDVILGIVASKEKTVATWRSIIHPDWLEGVDNYFTSVTGNKCNRFDKEYIIIRQLDRAERWIHVLGEILYDQNGKPEKMIGSIQDITERKNTEEKIRVSEEKYRTIFENVKDVFYQIDLNGTILEVSPSVSHYVAFSRDEIVGKSVYDFYSNSADRETLLNEIRKTGEIQEYELEFKVPSGSAIQVSMNARLVKDRHGNPAYIEGTIRNISKRKKVEFALRESELKLRSYFDYAPHGVFVSNAEGNYIEANKAASHITGYTVDELCSMDPKLLVADESIPGFVSHFQKSIDTGSATDEFLIVRKDKTTGYCRVDTVKIAPDLFMGFVIDINDRKNDEVMLKQRELFLRETQTIAQLGNFTIDFINHCWTSSDVLDTIFGIDQTYERLNGAWSEIIHPDSYAELSEYFLNDIVKNHQKVDKKVKIIKFDTGEERWVHAVGEPKFDDSDNVIHLIGTIQDVTEREETAEALRKSEALYRSVINTSPDAVIVVDLAGNIRMVSPVTVSMYGCTSESQLLGKNMFDFLVVEDRERAIINSSSLLTQNLGTDEYRVVLADGTIVHADVNGGVIYTEQGQPSGIVFILRDITEKKKVEAALKNSKEQLKEFAKHLESVREEERIMLAREIHDELGQILIAIKIDLGMTKQQVLRYVKKEDAAPFSANFDTLTSLVNNTISTTRKIMTDLRPEVLYLVGFVEAVKLHAKSFQERHKIKIHFRNEVSGLVLNSKQSITLYRIVQESLTNVARHSKATSVTLKISKQSGKLVLDIVDNGIGFDQAKKTKSGSYGLIGMKERVFLLDGEFSLVSQIGVGTNLKVQLPYA